LATSQTQKASEADHFALSLKWASQHWYVLGGDEFIFQD